MVAPRLATPRDPSAPTDGHAGAFVAHLHRRPWAPHQRLAADVLGELEPDGRYRYPLGVVLLPRQTGKTTFVTDLALGRCLLYRDYRCAYAAQTGHVTTERMQERMVELGDGPLGTRVRLRRSAGTERVTLPGRSYLKAFPPKPGALRSNALDLVLVDEAQEHGAVLGEQLDLTILPTFTTRPRRQLILVGTAGTDLSDYLRRYLAAARDRLPGYAVIEYGAKDTDDLEDEATWVLRHPGLGVGLTDLDALRTARAAMGPAGFAREFLNVWTRTGVRVIDPADWTACQTSTERPPGPVAFGLEVAGDRSRAAIAVAQAGGWCELVDRRPGIDWLLSRALELQARPAVCAETRAGPVLGPAGRAGHALTLYRVPTQRGTPARSASSASRACICGARACACTAGAAGRSRATGSPGSGASPAGGRPDAVRTRSR